MRSYSNVKEELSMMSVLQETATVDRAGQGGYVVVHTHRGHGDLSFWIFCLSLDSCHVQRSVQYSFFPIRNVYYFFSFTMIIMS